MVDEGKQTHGSFEWLRERLPGIPPAETESERELTWLDGSRAMAVARDTGGHLELFLPGPALTATVKSVADSLSHTTWWLKEGKPLEANRLQFAAAPHFDGVVAFLCAELIENGADTDLPGAFASSEPAIALALSRAALGNEVLVGLAGELFLIEGLTGAVPAGSADRVVAAWSGSVPSSRDFRFGTTGIEVKTTTGTGSKHHVQGLHQIEVGHADEGAPETGLFILSLGIKWSGADESGTSIPTMVDRIVARLAPDVAQSFLKRLAQYGGDAGSGYDHERDRYVATYARPFRTRFERLYDMGDPSIRLPRSGDLETFEHLDKGSLSFRIDLPRQVRGDVNPVSQWTEILGELQTAMDTP